MTTLSRLFGYVKSPNVWLTGSVVVAYALNGVVVFITAGALAVGDRGVYVGLNVTSLFLASISSFGLASTVSRWIALDALSRKSLLRVAVIGVALGLGGSLVIPFLQTAKVEFAAHASPTAIHYAMLAVPATILCDLVAQGFQGRGHFAAICIFRIGPPLIVMLGIVVALLLRLLTSTGAVFVYAATATLFGVIGLGILLLSVSAVGAVFNVKAFVAFAGRNYVSALTSLVNARLDAVVVATLLSTREVSLYSVATSLSVPVAAVGLGLSGSSFRRVANSVASRRQILVLTSWRRFSRGTVLMVCLLSAALPIAFTILGPRYSGSVPSTVILLVGTVGLGALYLGAALMNAMGFPGRVAIIQGATALLTLSTLFPMTTWFGTVGAAFSSGVSYVAGGVAVLVWSRVVARHTASAVVRH